MTELQKERKDREEPKAVWIGRPFGRILPFISDDRPSEAEILYPYVCIVSAVKNALAEVIFEHAGLCGNCTADLSRIELLLGSIINRESEPDATDVLSMLAEDIASRKHCPAVTDVTTPLLSSLRHFRHEYEAHVLAGNCPARVCQKLIPAPCQNACPAGIDIPGYLTLTARGQYAEALSLIREDNPFPWVCGMICPHPCEKVCVRAKLDEPVSIRGLKAFVAEQALKRSAFTFSRKLFKNGTKVAVIGSGPAGLTCASQLAFSGYSVTVFEALPNPGGLLTYGIPEYRLPRDIVRNEIDAIRSLGVEIKTGVTVGRDVTIDALRLEGFRSFFFGIGAHSGYRLGIEGEKVCAPVYDAISFLREVNSGKKESPGERVVVIGGGNSAMDAARTCIRLGSTRVDLAYRRTRAEMPANPQEIEEAIEEGVQLYSLTIPIRIGGEDGRVTYVECLRAELGEPDASGRRRPVPIEGSNFRIETDAVIAAIGQAPDLSPFGTNLPYEVGRNKLALTKAPNTLTETEDIFVGGDAVTGPATVVNAIAAGKQAAIDIDHYLSGKKGCSPLFLNHKRNREKFLSITAAEKIRTARAPARMADINLRKQNFEPVELSWSEDEARKEASRCLRCDVCIRCGACEKVCREQMKIEALAFKEITHGERVLSDYYRPAERCITCGACALSCPTGAIAIRDYEDSRELSLCGTVLNRTKMLRCDKCGTTFAPEAQMKFVEQTDLKMGVEVRRGLCPDCSRRMAAKNLAAALPTGSQG